MKLLLFAPKFKSYENLIYKEFQDRGVNVKMFKEHRFAIFNYLSILICSFYLKKHPDSVIFVINGKRWPKTYFKRLLRRSQSKKILYLWDSVRNYGDITWSDIFCNVFTFDKIDAENHGFCYRPTFYRDVVAEEKQKIIFGVFGGGQSYRISPIESLMEVAKSHLDFKVDIFFLDRKKSFLRRNDRIKWLHKAIKEQEYKRLIAQSMIVFDVTSPDQTGLTMRSLDALANGCILLTNNKSIHLETQFKSNIVIYDDKVSETNFRTCLRLLEKGKIMRLDDEFYSLSGFVGTFCNAFEF